MFVIDFVHSRECHHVDHVFDFTLILVFYPCFLVVQWIFWHFSVIPYLPQKPLLMVSFRQSISSL